MQLLIIPKLAPESTGDYAYRVLHQSITHVALKPGECVSPVEVANDLGMSRTPVQAAFARLLAEGLIDIYPQRGSYISMIDLCRVNESIYMRNLLDQSAIRALCQKGISKQAFTELANQVELLTFYYDHSMFSEAFEADSRFHQSIYLLCGMQNIYHALQQIAQDQQRVRYLKLFCGMRRIQTAQEHADMLDALCQRDMERACHLSSMHVSRFGLDIPAVHEVYPDYFIHWERFQDASYTSETGVFYHLPPL